MNAVVSHLSQVGVQHSIAAVIEASEHVIHVVGVEVRGSLRRVALQSQMIYSGHQRTLSAWHESCLQDMYMSVPELMI